MSTFYFKDLSMTVFSFRQAVVVFIYMWLTFGCATSYAEEFSYWFIGNGSVAVYSKPWQGCEYIFYVRSPETAHSYAPYWNRNTPWGYECYQVTAGGIILWLRWSKERFLVIQALH